MDQNSKTNKTKTGEPSAATLKLLSDVLRKDLRERGRPKPELYARVAEYLEARQDLMDRWMARVEPEPNSGCWLWTGSLNINGYATVNVKGVGSVCLHRLLYVVRFGEPGADLDCDHKCRVRECVNPEHLQPVTHRQNVRNGRVKKTHCHRGHALAGDNLMPTTDGTRCRTCVRIDGRLKYARRKPKQTYQYRKPRRARRSA